MITADVIVSARVAVVEGEDSAGAHATGRSAAIFVDSYGDDVVRTLSALSRPHFTKSSFLHDWPPLLTPRGLLHVARAGASPLADGDRRAALSRLTAEQACARVPILKRDEIAFAHMRRAPRTSTFTRC